MKRKLSWLLVITFVFANLATAFASPAEMTLVGKTAAVETIFYGTEQTGPLTERVSRLEKDVFAVESSREPLMNRISHLYSFAKENNVGQPSFLLKVNAVEWAIDHQVSGQQPARERMVSMERALVGNTAGGSYEKRVNDLMRLAYTDGQIDPVATTINKDALLKIQFVSPLSSKTSRVGDAVQFEAAEDIYMGGILVIAKGAKGIGKVSRVEGAQNFGRDAKLDIDFQSIELMDAQAASVYVGEKAKEETKSMAKTAGAAVAGIAILGPVGVLGGAFVKGESVEIKPGSAMYLQIKEDVNTYGIKVK